MSARSLFLLAPIAVDMLSPAGRCNRKGFLSVATVLLGTQIGTASLMFASGAAHEGPLGMMLNTVFLWLGIAATSKRLHDIDRSAWSILGAAFALVAWTVVLGIALILVLGTEALEPGGPGYWASLAGIMAPLLGLTLWLHFAQGTAGANRFGDEPSELGFSMPAKRPSSVLADFENEPASA